jgi:hypothetical protein
VSSPIETAPGNDTLTGVNDNSSGYGIWMTAGVRTGDGADTISGSSRDFPGIQLDPGVFCFTGNGNDRVEGVSGEFGTGIFLNSSGAILKTGLGADTIIGRSIAGIGIDVNDGLLTTGNQNDVIEGLVTVGSGSIGINLATGGEIKTGPGNDKIAGNNISNSGTIDTFTGNDLVEAGGGIAGDGTGKVILGDGSDRFVGGPSLFSTSTVEGGSGVDTLELTVSGTYTVSISGETTIFTRPFAAVLNTTGFEKLIVGANTLDFDTLLDGQTFIA